MILPPLLAQEAPKIGYAYAVGERTTYDLKGEIPMGVGEEGSKPAKGQLSGTFTMRVLSVAPDGTAEVEFGESGMTLVAMGGSFPMPPAEPMRVKLDRQGYQTAEPKSGSFSAVLILMFGVPGEALAVGRPFEWKPLGDALPSGVPASKEGASPTIRLRDVKDGKATLERSMTMKDGETLAIVTTHDLATGRVLKGEVAMKGSEHGEFKVALTLKSVTKDPLPVGGKNGR